ncbi:MAG: hypothetical protein AAFZ58_03940 [Pseudomonadota bacterium]
MTGKDDLETDLTDDNVDKDIDDEVDESEMTDTQILTSSNLSDDSVEINVEQLVTDIETVQSGGTDVAAARRRLESLMEEKRLVQAMRDLDEFDFEED